MITYVNRGKFNGYPVALSITVNDTTPYVLTNADIASESLTLSEALCSSQELEFGACESSTVEFTVLNTHGRLKGLSCVISMVLDDDDEHPFTLGTYKVISDRPSPDRQYRKIVAKDVLTDILNADVSSWWNGLTFPKTIKQLRESLLTHLGVQYETQTLTNDSVSVTKTVSGSGLTGASVIKAICQAHCGFGHINRSGKFEVKTLSALTGQTIPSLTLYPSSATLPSLGNIDARIDNYRVGEFDYEEYTSGNITQLRIRQDVSDAGVTVGTAGNLYSVDGNFLFYGKNAGELTAIANAMLAEASKVAYVPFEVGVAGDPCIEVGDMIAVVAPNGDYVISYVLERTLSGIYAMADKYESQGTEEYYRVNNGIYGQVQQLAGKTASLEVDVDGIRGDVTDITGRTASLEVDVGGIRGDVSDLATNTSASLSVLSSSIAGCVREGQSYNGMTISTSGISCNGTGSFTVDMSNFKVDSNGRVSIETDAATGYSRGVKIDSSGITVGSTAASYYTQIAYGAISANSFALFPTECTFRAPVTIYDNLTVTGSIAGTVSYATAAGTATKAGSADSADYATNAGSASNGLFGASCTSGGFIHCTNIRGDNFTVKNSNAPSLTLNGSNYIQESTQSSRRFKKYITANLPSELNPHKLYDIDVVKYNYKEGYLGEEDDRYHKDFIGLIAEDVYEKYPLACDLDSSGQPANWNSRILLPAMLKLIQEQHAEIESLKARVSALEGGN